MDIDKHLVIFKKGIKFWNEWRKENINLQPVLSETNLTGYNLTGYDLEGVFFIETNLTGANLQGNDLCNTMFHDVKLIRANLRGANLRGANLSEANLSEAYLVNTNLFNANLSGSNLFCSNLIGANLVKANLKKANLTLSNLVQANLSESDLVGANFTMSQVIDANFKNATLTDACIENWLINNKTNLNGVVCEYIYIDEKKTERRPSKGNFAPGEFASLYEKIINNTDIIMSKTLEKNNINNQGVQFYSNQTIHTWQNLNFRSKSEIKMAEALDRSGVLFLPNCLSRLNTTNGRANRESDFLVCYKGNWGILEVDGEAYHRPESRFREQERERDFKKYGIKVIERYDAKKCYENPDSVVKEFFHMMEITYS